MYYVTPLHQQGGRMNKTAPPPTPNHTLYTCVEHTRVASPLLVRQMGNKYGQQLSLHTIQNYIHDRQAGSDKHSKLNSKIKTIKKKVIINKN